MGGACDTKEERTDAAGVFAEGDFSAGCLCQLFFSQSAAPARSPCRFAYRTRKGRVAQEVGARRPFRDWISGCFQCHPETLGKLSRVHPCCAGACADNPRH